LCIAPTVVAYTHIFGRRRTLPLTRSNPCEFATYGAHRHLRALPNLSAGEPYTVRSLWHSSSGVVAFLHHMVRRRHSIKRTLTSIRFVASQTAVSAIQLARRPAVEVLATMHRPESHKPHTPETLRSIHPLHIGCVPMSSRTTRS